MKYVSNLTDLMVMQLQSLYDAEKIWSEALIQNAPAIYDNDLKYIFEKGSVSAARHETVLKSILVDLGKWTISQKNVVAIDLVREMKEIKDISADPEVLDAGMIVTHQCMNHYMITKYGTVASFAQLLGEGNIATQLHTILEEEKREDEYLTKLAQDKINIKAKIAFIH